MLGQAFGLEPPPPARHAPQPDQALRLQVLRRAHHLPAARPAVGVVGPNGCGKSNIMDAVRWVLGESKASELRGESMQDVIFNGSRPAASRPAAPASSWSSTTTTGARRRPVEPVRRDRRQARAHARRHQQLLHQQPAGAPARRAGRVPGHRPGPARLRHHRPGHDQPHHRDRKPEELRLFLEEAAGVSKYKERRRETENRLKDTRENLTRVDDILRELNANLEKLEKQAEVAQPVPRAAGAGHAQAAPAVVPEAPRRGQRGSSACKPARARSHQRAGSAHGRAAPRRGRAGDGAPGALRRQRRAARSAGRAGRGGAGSQPAGRAHPLRGRRPPARRAAPGRAAGAERAVGRSARPRRDAELERIAEQIAAADEQSRACWPRRPKSRRGSCPTLEDAVRAAQSASNQQRSAVTAGAAADPGAGGRKPQRRRAVAPAAAAPRAAGRRAPGPGRARPAARWTQLQRAERRGRARRRRWPRRGCTSWTSRCRRWTSSAAPAQAAVNAEAAPPGRPQRAAGGAARAAGEGADRGQAQALAGQARPGRPAGPVDAGAHRARLGNRARSRAARAPQRAGGRPAGHRARLRRRRAAGAGWPSTRRRRRASPTRTRRCRAWPTCCAWATPA